MQDWQSGITSASNPPRDETAKAGEEYSWGFESPQASNGTPTEGYEPGFSNEPEPWQLITEGYEPGFDYQSEDDELYNWIGYYTEPDYGTGSGDWWGGFDWYGLDVGGGAEYGMDLYNLE